MGCQENQGFSCLLQLSRVGLIGPSSHQVKEIVSAGPCCLIRKTHNMINMCISCQEGCLIFNFNKYATSGVAAVNEVTPRLIYDTP